MPEAPSYGIPASQCSSPSRRTQSDEQSGSLSPSHMHARKTASSLSIADDEMRHMLTTSSASFAPVLLSAFNGNKPESTKTASGHHPTRNTWKDTVRRPSSAMDDMDIENNQNNPCRRTRRAWDGFFIAHRHHMRTLQTTGKPPKSLDTRFSIHWHCIHVMKNLRPPETYMTFTRSSSDRCRNRIAERIPPFQPGIIRKPLNCPRNSLRH